MQNSDAAAYFIALGPDEYEPTEHTGGAWRDDEQHLAPVAGLVVHHMDKWREAHADPALAFARFTFEVYGQIPRETMRLNTEVVRPGRTIELIETTAMVGDRVIIRGHAWLLRTSDTSSVAGDEFVRLDAPSESSPGHQIATVWGGGFINSVRAVAAGEVRPGRASMWITSDLPLVQGEPASPLAEFLKYIDTANGAATRESPKEWMYPNVELTVHLFKQPRGTWVGLDTRVAFGDTGIGLTSSVLHDLNGPVGTVQQSLTVRKL